MYDLNRDIHSVSAVVGKRPPHGKLAADNLLYNRPALRICGHKRRRTLVEDAVDLASKFKCPVDERPVGMNLLRSKRRVHHDGIRGEPIPLKTAVADVGHQELDIQTESVGVPPGDGYRCRVYIKTGHGRRPEERSAAGQDTRPAPGVKDPPPLDCALHGGVMEEAGRYRCWSPVLLKSRGRPLEAFQAFEFHLKVTQVHHGARNSSMV